MTKYTIARKFENKKGQTVVKRPNIQRLVTPLTLQVSDTQDLTLHVFAVYSSRRTMGPLHAGFTQKGALPMRKKTIHRPVLNTRVDKHAPLSDGAPPFLQHSSHQ